VAIGVALSAAAVPLMDELSSIAESARRAEIAVAALGHGGYRDERREMQLRAVIGAAFVSSRGCSLEASAAWEAVLDSATRLGDGEFQARALWGLWTAQISAGALRTALGFAQRFSELAARGTDEAKVLLGHRITAITLHYLGRHAQARALTERMLARHDRTVHRTRTLGFRVDHSIAGRAMLARILWLQGFPDQAIGLVRATVADAEAYGHAYTLCYVLVEAAVLIALFAGDLEGARRLIAMLLDLTDQHGLAIWHIFGRYFHETLRMRTGDLAGGIAGMRVVIDDFRETGSNADMSALLMSLAKGLERAGELDDAHAVIEEALAQSARREERWALPELLRTKGEIVLESGDKRAAEAIFIEALGIAREQDALAWELRCATSLARLRQEDGRAEEGRAQLASVYGRFTEGFATKDLGAARALLES
jgi:predicted ATPase